MLQPGYSHWAWSTRNACRCFSVNNDVGDPRVNGLPHGVDDEDLDAALDQRGQHRVRVDGVAVEAAAQQVVDVDRVRRVEPAINCCAACHDRTRFVSGFAASRAAASPSAPTLPTGRRRGVPSTSAATRPTRPPPRSPPQRRGRDGSPRRGTGPGSPGSPSPPLVRRTRAPCTTHPSADRDVQSACRHPMVGFTTGLVRQLDPHTIIRSKSANGRDRAAAVNSSRKSPNNPLAAGSPRHARSRRSDRDGTDRPQRLQVTGCVTANSPRRAHWHPSGRLRLSSP